MTGKMKWPVALLIGIMFTDATLIKSTYNDSVRLYRDMTQNYDSRVRPIFDQSEAITVFTKMHINSLFEIDEVRQIIKMNAWVNFTWYDQLRVWNPEEYGNISVIHPNILDMWRPRVLVNSSVTEVDVFKDGNMNSGIFSNGKTYWFPSAVFHNYCEMDFTYFPFDKHECKVIFISTDLESEVEFLEGTFGVYQEAYTSNGEWDFTEFTTGSLNFSFSPAVGSFFVQMHFERRPKFFVMQMLIPMVVTSAMSSLVFILPASSGERASYATTMMLAMTVLTGSVTDQLSKKSDRFPIIIYYLSSLITLNVVSVIASVLQMRIVSLMAKRLETCNKQEKHINVHDKRDCSSEGRCSTVVKSNKVHHDALNRNYAVDQNDDVVCLEGRDTTDHFSSSTFQKSEFPIERFGKALVSPGTETNPSNSNVMPLQGSFRERMISFLKDIDVILFSLYIFITSVVNIYFISKLTEQSR